MLGSESERSEPEVFPQRHGRGILASGFDFPTEDTLTFAKKMSITRKLQAECLVPPGKSVFGEESDFFPVLHRENAFDLVEDEASFPCLGDESHEGGPVRPFDFLERCISVGRDFLFCILLPHGGGGESVFVGNFKQDVERYLVGTLFFLRFILCRGRGIGLFLFVLGPKSSRSGSSS